MSLLTANDVIFRADEYKPNPYPAREKIETLCGLEDRISSELIASHYDPAARQRELTPDGDGGAALLIQDRPLLYFYRLICEIDLRNGDLVRYANDSALFNSEWESFRNEYNRTHPAKSAKLRY
ncbi:MAG: hypothetical protein IJR90_02725 [Clostridia bacterium]|nr:hypothetical protein [Clostridia bacterium]